MTCTSESVALIASANGTTLTRLFLERHGTEGQCGDNNHETDHGSFIFHHYSLSGSSKRCISSSRRLTLPSRFQRYAQKPTKISSGTSISGSRLGILTHSFRSDDDFRHDLSL